ncbi:MAG TPA: hypothetical protein VN328_07400, partial [Thermodesulfovibrionales bacterium]|nr:hypothetical protein [Thermodesulfovibrionales bacterium]
AYRVDVRLRPDGTKGPLVSTTEALTNYYSRAAHFWEFQALLKARPIAGDKATCCRFLEMRKDILGKRGPEVAAADIRAMRERIHRELAREKEGYDIKLGRGGIEELEFTVQYLQLVNGDKYPMLFVQGTLEAIKRLTSAQIVGRREGEFMKDTYLFYRTLESFMRLRGEPVLRQPAVADASEFMGFVRSEDFIEYLTEKRTHVRELFEKLLS